MLEKHHLVGWREESEGKRQRERKGGQMGRRENTAKGSKGVGFSASIDLFC